MRKGTKSHDSLSSTGESREDEAKGDPSGASNYTASTTVGGSGAGQSNTPPSQVSVRYCTAPSVATNGNFQWVCQHRHYSHGRHLASSLFVSDVPAPGFALVFLTSQALQESTPNGSQVTFATTAATATLKNTATIDTSVLATSNGRGGSSQQLGSTSFGSSSGAVGVMHALPGALALGCMAAGAAVVGRYMMR
ncbi:hypothetical protein JB92DRAFT_3094362 [Gautieria morchelliformis]|nr:hypothetical protein JB92DRAFT_3094362 [Gautieria morchelliformis]